MASSKSTLPTPESTITSDLNNSTLASTTTYYQLVRKPNSEEELTENTLLTENALLPENNSTFDYFSENGNMTADFVHKLNSPNFSSTFLTTNSTSSLRSSHFAVPVGYVIGMTGAGLAILAVLVIIAVCWKRQRAVLLPEHSIYTVQDSTGWDNISLHYIDNPADFIKDNSWDDLSDDSYLASLDEVIAQRASVNSYTKRNRHSGTPVQLEETTNFSQQLSINPIHESINGIDHLQNGNATTHIGTTLNTATNGSVVHGVNTDNTQNESS